MSFLWLRGELKDIWYTLLTLIGGGAFGNNIEWIIAALQRAIRIYAGEYMLDMISM